jgi:hypothetical protein
MTITAGNRLAAFGAALWHCLNTLPPGSPSAKSPLERNGPLQSKTLGDGPLRYLIAVEDQLDGKDGEIIEVGYSGPKPRRGRAIRYCNLLNQTTRDYGPYLQPTDTAGAYDEKVVKPFGAGWCRLLQDQYESALAAGFEEIELDNSDAYSRDVVLGAVDYAASRGLKVWAKNPLACPWDPTPYISHPAVIGVIVERGAGNPADMHALRVNAGKPNLPVRFVAFRNRKEDGRAWAGNTAHAAQPFKNMGGTFSLDGEYTSSADILVPR